MNVNFIPQKFKTEHVEICFVSKQKELTSTLEQICFSIEENSIYFDIYDKILYIGLPSFNTEEIKIVVAKAIRHLSKTNYRNFYISLSYNPKYFSLNALLEGMFLGSYRYETYKNTKKYPPLTAWISYDPAKLEKNVLEEQCMLVRSICESVNMVRDIVNTPPQDYTPSHMVEDALDIAQSEGLMCHVYGEKELVSMNMNSMLAVARASVHEAKLIHLTYKPENATKKVVLVGKGLTYDSGGLSLKSSEGMISMKCDKAGGAAVLGIMKTLKTLGITCEVHGIIGAVENMIGGDAYKPDDVLTAKNGITIEVKNTDAEGRLVLADALCYAQDEISDIDYIFDLATLTGASIVAMGNHTSAIMGHSDPLKRKFQKAAEKSGELVGFLPYNRYFDDVLKSEIADIVNTSASRSGSAITASLFLDHFILPQNKMKWLHFDIAGPSFVHKEWGYNPYGASGVGVRMFLAFLKELEDK